LQLVVADVRLPTVEVEVDVVGQVDRTGPVNRRTILDSDAVIFSKTVVRRGFQVAGKTLVAVIGSEGKQRLMFVGANDLPATFVKPSGPPCS
jgi:hypothetical protein